MSQLKSLYLAITLLLLIGGSTYWLLNSINNKDIIVTELDTDLHIAAKLNDSEAIKTLSKTSDDLNSINILGNTPLIEATISNNYDAAKALLETPFPKSYEKINLVRINNEGGHALYYAARNGNVDLVELLIKKGIVKEVKKVVEDLRTKSDGMGWDFGYMEPMYAAAINGHVDVLKMLRESNSREFKEDNGEYDMSLWHAISGSQLKIIDYFASLPEDIRPGLGDHIPNSRHACGDATYLTNSIKEIDTETLRHILKDAKSLLKDTTYDLAKGDPLKYGASGCYSETTPLLEAIESGDPEKVKILVEHGLDVNQITSTYLEYPNDLISPLTYAENLGFEGIAKYLKLKGAVESIEDDFRDLLELSYRGSSSSGVWDMPLIGSAASLDSIEFSKEENIEFIEIIKNLKAVDVQDEMGLTALHLAAARGSSESIKLLIEKGADKDALAYIEEYAPLDYAKKRGNAEIIKLLK